MAGSPLNARYAPLYVAAGKAFNIPPAVLAGVADVETNGGQNIATSSTGAQGLMQFEPGTARSLGVNPADPRSAIFGAAKLLTQYGYHQNPTRAIGAYNGGPGNPQYGYAQQVLQSAKRLSGALRPYLGGNPPAPAQGRAPGLAGFVTTPDQYVTNMKNTFDQAGFDQAEKAFIAGSFLKNEKNPFDIGPKTPGMSNPLLASGLLTTKAPDKSAFVSAQTVLQKIAGQKIPLMAHPSLIQKTRGGYVNPLPGATIGRTDMGVDANLPAGHPILAIGDSKVVGVSPNWYRGQPYVLFQLLNGPKAGQYYYVAEAINPTVRPGQTVRAGQTVGTYNPNGTGLELGWGSPVPGRTLAQQQGNTGDASHNNAPAGISFRNFLNGL